jgi:hypothetical protein
VDVVADGALEGRRRAGEEAFRAEMLSCSRGVPAGRLALPSLTDLAERVAAIERRLDRIESGAAPDERAGAQ